MHGRLRPMRPGMEFERTRKRPSPTPRTLVAVGLVIVATTCLGQIPATNFAWPTAWTSLAASSKRISFRSVIEATTGQRVLSFDTNNAAHLTLRRQIERAASLAGERAKREGLTAPRVNEAGNQIEPFVRAALRDVGLEARVPHTRAGDAQAAGYPDVEILGPAPCYLELKTFNARTANTTQRSFYYSPSRAPKVTRDALHALLAFELEKRDREGGTVFVPVRWQLLTLEDLEVELKLEFNQSNRGLYGNTNAVLGGEAIP